MKLINKLSYMFFIGFGLAAFSLTAMEDQDDLSYLVEEIDLTNVDGIGEESEPISVESIEDLIKEAKFQEKFDIKNPGEGFIVRNALENFEEEAQNYKAKNPLSLKELVAKCILGQSIDLETLEQKLPKELIEYLKELIIQDQKMLPFLVKKLKSGSEKQRCELIAKCAPFFDFFDESALGSDLTNYNEEDRDKIIFQIQIFIKFVIGILREGTVKQVNEIIIIAQDYFHFILNFARDGKIDATSFTTIDISSLIPMSQEMQKEINEQVIDLTKNGAFKLETIQPMANNPEFREFFDKLINKTRKKLNLIFEAEMQIPRILRNKNIDRNDKYENKTALEWAKENENNELSGFLVKDGAVENVTSYNMTEIYQLLMEKRYSSIVFSILMFSCLLIIYYDL